MLHPHREPFPADFLWGAASAAYQVEGAWNAAEEEPEPFTGDEPPYGYPLEHRSLGPRATVSQTFYIESEQPNVIFAADPPVGS